MEKDLNVKTILGLRTQSARAPSVEFVMVDTLPRLILIIGNARSGKDTVADVFARSGYTKLQFSTKLKTACMTFLKDVYEVDVTQDDMEGRGIDREAPIESWVLARKPLTIRRCMQWLGTDLVRDLIGDSVWIDAMEIPNTNTVISDVRFPNEISEMQRRFSDTHEVVILRVIRSGVETSDHVSETALMGFKADHVLTNNSTQAALEAKVVVGFEL